MFKRLLSSVRGGAESEKSMWVVVIIFVTVMSAVLCGMIFALLDALHMLPC